MSNTLREIVELTKVGGLVRKAVLLHIADTVRDHDQRFWRSQIQVAKRLDTDPKTIRRNINRLIKDGLVSQVDEKSFDGKTVAVLQIDLEALLSRPCVEAIDKRAELAKKLASSVRGSEPYGKGLRALGSGAESPTNHTLHTSPSTLLRREDRSDNTQSARADACREHPTSSLDAHVEDLTRRFPDGPPR